MLIVHTIHLYINKKQSPKLDLYVRANVHARVGLHLYASMQISMGLLQLITTKYMASMRLQSNMN
jgi:hypothetical protein